MRGFSGMIDSIWCNFSRFFSAIFAHFRGDFGDFSLMRGIFSWSPVSWQWRTYHHWYHTMSPFYLLTYTHVCSRRKSFRNRRRGRPKALPPNSKNLTKPRAKRANTKKPLPSVAQMFRAEYAERAQGHPSTKSAHDDNG